ncbi:MAG TPA: cbb3-type cytochrome c oxidase subunit 3 [Novosphingobium sp.]|nr:cbb3-type cytochrome c oxidase subunit 3 [Novosphingobium sp.]
MSGHSMYETLRQIADSWALAAMGAAFLVLIAWPFRPGSKSRNHDAATMIFKDENDG